MRVKRRRGFWKAAVVSSMMLITMAWPASPTLPSPKDYSRLVELIKVRNEGSPLHVFCDFEEAFDDESHKANLKYFDEHPGLVRKIQEDLDGEELRWRLDRLMRRLLFVPEERQECATLFENYCHDVIDYVLDKAELTNPYNKIEVLREERPKIPEHGVTVFLVHNLAQESVATYVFSNHSNKSLVIELNGKYSLGEVGSYTTHVWLRDNPTYEFIKDNYTIWQNSANNPYTVLTVPAEETLHIALREYTHRAIKEQLLLNSVRNTQGAEHIVEDWIAVEEAVVGGLVHTLVPCFLEQCVKNLPYSLIEEDIEAKSRFEQYRYLKKGIEVVKSMGYKKALKMYKTDPIKFRELLLQPIMARS